jgi:hypothetical protein
MFSGAIWSRKNLYCLPTVEPFFDGYRASSVKLLKIQGTTANRGRQKRHSDWFSNPRLLGDKDQIRKSRVNIGDIGAGRQQMENLTSALEYKGCPPKDMCVARPVHLSYQ